MTAREEQRRRLGRDRHDGLGPALATQTLKLESARRAGGDAASHVVVDAPGHPPLPAAYQIALEALNNVAIHAAAHARVIRLGVCNGLHLNIRDVGCGQPHDRRAGVGLLSMRERADALGGQFEVDLAPGGGTADDSVFAALRAGARGYVL